LGRALEEARRLGAELSRCPTFARESAQITQSVDQAIAHLDWLRRGRRIAIAEILGPTWLGLTPDRDD
jgi:hypothetical protein